MVLRSIRSAVALAIFAVSTAFAARAHATGAGTDKVFDAVNAYEVVFYDVGTHGFAVTGLLHGQSTEQRVFFKYYDSSTVDHSSCERLALTALKSAGKVALIINSDDPSATVYSCRLERR
jgi:hypothetical protein